MLASLIEQYLSPLCSYLYPDGRAVNPDLSAAITMAPTEETVRGGVVRVIE